MAKSKLRLTGFARLFIALIFIIPLAYLGAIFIEGGEGLNNLKEMAGIESTEVEEVAMPEKPMAREESVAQIEQQEEDLTREALAPPPMEKGGEDEEAMNELREKLNEMYDENSALKEEILKLRKALAEKEVNSNK